MGPPSDDQIPVQRRTRRRRLILASLSLVCVGGFLSCTEFLGTSGSQDASRLLSAAATGSGGPTSPYHIVDLRELVNDLYESTPSGNNKRVLEKSSHPTTRIPSTARSEKTPDRKKRLLEEGPTLSNVSYGPFKENVLDFWQSNNAQNTEQPTPLAIFIHGGGWAHGDKSIIPGDISPSLLLQNGISYVSINYRLMGELTEGSTTPTTLPAPVEDAIRAIKFVKYMAKEWNVDKDRIALTGMSAGSATAMYILFNEDFAMADSNDPVERESTQLRAAATFCGQASIDPYTLLTWIGSGAAEHEMIYAAVGEDSFKDMMDNYEQHKSLLREYSPISHIGRTIADKPPPPLYMTYLEWTPTPCQCEYNSSGDWRCGKCIHHPIFGRKIKDRCKEAGITCFLNVNGESGVYPTAIDFLLDYLSPEEEEAYQYK